MAFLQTDFPPSTAPIHVRVDTPAAPRRPVRAVPKRRLPLGKLAAAGAAIMALAMPGYAVFESTESLPLAILAADFCFLIAVAGWSAISRR